MSRTYEGSLVLSRKEGERAYIIRENEEPICVKIERVKGDGVRIGIHADRDCLILREEVLERGDRRIYESVSDGEIVTSEMYFNLREQK